MSTPIGASQWMYSAGEFDIGQSVKFNDDDSQYLSWTPTSAGNRKTWTWAGWLKRGNLSTEHSLFSAHITNTNQTDIYINSTNTIVVQDYQSSTTINATTSAVFRDPSAWYHIVVAVDTTQATNSNGVKVYINGVQQTLTFSAYTQNQDTMVNSTNSHKIGSRYSSSPYYLDGYLADVYFIDGTALDPTSFGETVNGYWKAKEYSGTFGTNGWHLNFKDDVVSEGFNTVTYTGTGAAQSISGLGLTPDLVWLKERTDADAHLWFDSVRGPNKKIYSNLTNAEGTIGDELMSFDADGFSLGASGNVTTNGNKMVGWCWDAGANNAATGHSSVTYKGNATDNTEIRGLPFEPDLLWIKERTSTSGHILVDSVRGSTSNVMNSLLAQSTAAEDTSSAYVRRLTDKGFVIASGGSTNSSSDTYIAWAWDAGTGSAASNTDGDITSTVKASSANGFSIVTYTGTGSTSTIGHSLSSAPELIIVKNRSSTANWQVYTTVIDGSLDVLNLNLTNAKTDAGVSLPTSSVFSVGGGNTTGASGNNYVAYCFHSVSGYSDIGTYTGNGSASGPTVTTGFRPGFVLAKRTDSAISWVMFDGTRDPLNPVSHRLNPNSTSAEGTNVDLCNFTDTGFTITTADNVINASGGTYIYAAFKGSYSDYVSDFNTDGSVDSRVKANPSYGFSITSYTGNGTAGATIGHGLSSAPEFLAIHSRDTAQSWLNYDAANGGTNYMALQSTQASSANSDRFNNTDPTSSVITLGTHVACNTNAEDYICYAWHSVSGYSKFGSYSGTGSTGNAVTGLGFEPAFLMVKRTDSTSNWAMYDNTRSTIDPRRKNVWANLSDFEYDNSAYDIDFDADGFTLQTSDSQRNASGGTYIYMAFADTREYSFFKDVSGNGNHWTPNNLDYRDSMLDTPQNNFATMSPIMYRATQSHVTLSEGNLRVTNPNSTVGFANFAVDSGKWYWEIFIENNGTTNSNDYRGVIEPSAGQTSSGLGGSPHFIYNFYTSQYRIDNGSFTSNDAGTAANPDVIGFAWDADNGYMTVSINGVAGTTITGLTTGTAMCPFVANDYNAIDIINFGQDSTFSGAKAPGSYTDANGIGSFQYDPGSYLSLCTSNLPTPTIVDGSEHFNTVLWTGNGGTQSITGVGFQPSVFWTKTRSAAGNHFLLDIIRGDSKFLFPDTTNAEATASGGTVEIASDGVDITTYATTGFNISSVTHASWAWKAGGTAVTNNDGNVTTQVSANPDAGFSILTWTYTGDGTLGHGLNQAPELWITKPRSGYNWWTFTNVIDGSQDYLALNLTNAYTNDTYSTSGATATTIPTDNSFHVGDMVAYVFHSVDGFSKVGSYTGNGSSDGTFVYTGFRPAFVMVKRTDSTGNWVMADSARDTYNVVDALVSADISDAEYDIDAEDFLSNGFKMRDTHSTRNASGGSYIYLAIAETPFKYANAR